MTYLSKLILNPRSRDVRRDLADCANLHCRIMSAFPKAASVDNGARHAFSVLYRLDFDERGARPPTLLVQSSQAPSWSVLEPSYFCPMTNGEQNPVWKQIDDSLKAIGRGAKLTFRLRANPTKRVHAANAQLGASMAGKRIALEGEEEQIAWLKRKATEAGFRVMAVRAQPGVPDAQVIPDGRITGERCRPAAGGAAGTVDRLVFGSVLFDGHLEVFDADLFRAALSLGIGPGKAYGFGLLSIAPAQ